MKENLLSVDCSIAPYRDALLPIMASAHFGNGDKSRWGYLGNRKDVYDEWKGGRSINQLATAFDRKPTLIGDLIVEYQLYLDALELPWTEAERNELLDPGVEFNPPVRFLQTSGHKSATGIALDRVNLKVVYETPEAASKFQHLVRKLVIDDEKGMGATASYADVFADYKLASESPDSDGGNVTNDDAQTAPEMAEARPSDQTDAAPRPSGEKGSAKLKPGALFDYVVTSDSLVLKQLMKEARSLNTKTFPAAGTALIRNILEVMSKHIIDDQDANKDGRALSLESTLSLIASKAVQLSKADKDILKEFARSHLDYINLGVHGNVVPNHQRLMSVRDTIDQFVKRNV